MSNQKKGMFVTPDGQNVVFTFILVTSLFLLWGFCNGMIDVMDKHFQDELGLTKAQSAWVQFAHYLGYFLMSIPAGWLATKLGYKGGIITGLVIVAAGGFWFIPATSINDMVRTGQVSANMAFVAFLFGVCLIATGLTFLETIANPYTTVLGDPQYAATRINLAQSTNGIGWIFGPIVGSMYFYSKNAQGQSTGSATLYIPYAGIAVAVLILAVIFYFANIPDIKAEDDYHLDDTTPGVSKSIWSHPHFVMAVAAQFVYVAAQAGIFSFFINYLTADVPPIPASWDTGMKDLSANAGFLSDWLSGWFHTTKDGVLAISDKGAANIVANVSHDLKTPLTAITGWSQALIDGAADGPGERLRAAETIHDEADRMARLVNELLDLARLESGQLQMIMRPVDLNAVLADVHRGQLPRARAKHIDLQLDAAEGASVQGDPDRLAQIFTNLADNALAYTPPGGIVRLATRAENGWVEGIVTDTGPGIPAEELPRVFERFYRLEKSRVRSEGGRGSGLGLAIVNELVAAHGGQVRVVSEVGQGSAFVVRLPAVEHQ